MIEKILEKREIRLKKEFLKLGLNEIDVDVMVDIHNTDIGDYSGDELVRFYVQIEDDIYNIFVKEKHLKDNEESESENILYKNMARSILECIENNLVTKKELLFLVVNYEVLKLDCYRAKESIIIIEKALEIYNAVYKDYNKDYKLNYDLENIEFLKRKFKGDIFKVANVELISVFNLIYRLI